MLEIPTHPTEPMLYARWLAQCLQENTTEAFNQIYHMTIIVGIATIQEIYERTLEVEANGGLMTLSGERRRTIGGAFFFLSRSMLSKEIADEIFLKPWQKDYRERRLQREQAMDWLARFNVISDIKQQGTINQMKVTLTGQPNDIAQNGSTVILQMSHTLKYGHSNYPSGTPLADLPPVVYTIYIAEKMWKKVEEEVAKPDYQLHINGVCQFDPETQTIAVLAEHVKTEEIKKPQNKGISETRQKVSTSNGTKKPTKGKKPFTPFPKTQKQAVKVPNNAAPLLNLPDDIPGDVAAKAQELHSAINKLQGKIASLKASKQTAGLKMTERLLENTENQLTTLLSPYR